MQHHYTNKKKIPYQRNFKCKRTKTQKVQRVKTISVAETHAVISNVAVRQWKGVNNLNSEKLLYNKKKKKKKQQKNKEWVTNSEKFKESKLSSRAETRSKELFQMVWIIDDHDTIITTKSISLKILVWNMEALWCKTY